MTNIKTEKTLIELLATSELFASFDQPTLAMLVETMEKIFVHEGEYVLRQGETQNSGLYVVIEGKLQALIRQKDNSEQIVGEIEPGGIIGEMQLLAGQARAASVQALTDTRLAFLAKDTFDRLTAKNPQILSLLGQVIHQRLRRNQLFQILPHYLGTLDLEIMEAIEDESQWIHLEAGDMLVRYQDPSDSFFIVINGRVQARVPTARGGEQPVADIFAGENVGETGFFTDEPRTASVYALRGTDLIRISKESFYRLQTQYPQITLQFAKQSIKRLLSITPGRTPRNSLNIALIPASPETHLTEFANQLVRAVAQHTHGTLINSAFVDEIFQHPGFSQMPKGDINEIRLAAWLDEQEKTYPLISFYATDATPSNWTTRCLERADRVIFVGKAGTEPDLAYLQTMAPPETSGVRKELVLLYDSPDPKPSDTAQWLEQMGDIRRHYHIQSQCEADYGRMARLLTGNAVGLVLGGGGARGFAHIGVLRAVEELGLEVDLIGGTSMGSIIGAAYATGMDSQTIYEIIRRELQEKKILDYTFPAASILAGKPFTQALIEIFKNMNIEDTWIEYFCVSANLTQAKEIIHQQGPLWKYTRASSALPPVFSPVAEGGDLLADGVLVNNLPMDVMKRHCEGGRVIGVDVSSEEHLEGNYDFAPVLSGWQVLWNRINPFRREIDSPRLFNIVMRVSEFSSVRLKREQYDIADLMIRPDVEDIELFALDAFEEIVELGYEAGKKSLENWLRK